MKKTENQFCAGMIIFAITTCVFFGLWMQEKEQSRICKSYVTTHLQKMRPGAPTDVTLITKPCGTGFSLLHPATDNPVDFKIDHQKYLIGGFVKNRTNTIATFKSIDGKEFDYNGVFKDTYVTVDSKEFLIKSEDLNKNFLKEKLQIEVWTMLSHTNQFFIYDPNYQWTISSNIIKSIRKQE